MQGQAFLRAAKASCLFPTCLVCRQCVDMQREKQALLGSEAKAPVGMTSITHCSWLPAPDDVVVGKLLSSAIKDPAALKCQSRICPTAQFSLSWLKAGLSKVSPFLAQGTGFPSPGHQHHQQVWSSTSLQSH